MPTKTALYSESAPPTATSDFLNASMPTLFTTGLGPRIVKLVAEADK